MIVGYFNQGFYYQQILSRIQQNMAKKNWGEAKALCHQIIRELSGVLILTYHEIGYGNNQFCIQPRVFENQLRYIKERQFPVLTYDTLTEWDYRQRGILITFDDARAGIGTFAAPLLQAYGFPYTIFVAPGYLSQPDQIAEKERFSDFLSWNGLRELLSYQQLTIGAHSYSHRAMVDLEFQELLFEIQNSKLELEDRLGIKVKDFAYPYGKFSPAIEKMVIEEGYRTISTINPGFNTAETPLFRLRRSLILQLFSETGFETLVNPSSIEKQCRQILDELREKSGGEC